MDIGRREFVKAIAAAAPLAGAGAAEGADPAAAASRYAYMDAFPGQDDPMRRSGALPVAEDDTPEAAEPRIPTMDGKVIVEAAIPGWTPVWWYRKRGVRHLPPGGNGGPTCAQEQADAIVECVRAGASVIHTHPRHPDDGQCRSHAPELLADIMDRAFAQADFITAHHTWGWDFRRSWEADYVSYPAELLRLGQGNKYVQMGMIMTIPAYAQGAPLHSPRAIAQGVEFFEENRIKPVFSCETFALDYLKNTVFDRGVARSKPYWIALQLGKHLDQFTNQDPGSYRLTIDAMERVRQNLPEADLLLGVHPAGRNWLAMATVALLYGARIVRVGLEDQFHLYPHRDDVSRSASDTTRLVVNLIRALGREVATVEEARNLAGIRWTSPR